MYTSCVVAARLRDAEKTNVMKIATDTRAATLAKRVARRFTDSTCRGGMTPLGI
jgi:hypothetical protein